MHIGKLLQERSKPFVSLEFFPPSDTATLPEFYNVVARLGELNPLFVSVTYGAGGSKQDRTLHVTAKLVEMGLITMPHLTCVGATRDSLASYVQKLADVGVDNILALRGDAPKDGSWQPEGQEFQHASDLVRFVAERWPAMGIAVAGYPTPHPESKSYTEDRAYTVAKLNCGADFAITQLFFDVREYLQLVEELGRHGLTKPIIPGILTLQSFQALKRILSLSGANIPGNLYLKLEEADQKGGAKAVREAGIRFAEKQIRQLLESGAPGVHLYTLNKADVCLELMDRVGRM